MSIFTDPSAKIQEWIIFGKVQGVGFRYFVREEARRLGLRGWVENLFDGRVRVVVTGDAGGMGELNKLCHQGPPASRVDGVEVKISHIHDISTLPQNFQIH